MGFLRAPRPRPVLLGGQRGRFLSGKTDSGAGAFTPSPPPPPPPPPCLIEDFTTFPTGYTTLSGDAGLFTADAVPYTNTLHIGSQDSVTPAAIRRSFSDRLLSSFSCGFYVVGTSAGADAGYVMLSNSGVGVLQFTPRRSLSFDSALRRPYLTLDAETIYLGPSGGGVGSGGVLTDTWYTLTLTIAVGAGNTVATITKNSDASVFFTTPLVSSHTPPTVNQLSFYVTGGAPETSVDDWFIAISACGSDVGVGWQDSGVPSPTYSGEFPWI